MIVLKDAITENWCARWAESLLAKTEDSSFVMAYNPHWVGTITLANSMIVDDDDRRELQSIFSAMDCMARFFDDTLVSASKSYSRFSITLTLWTCAI